MIARLSKRNPATRDSACQSGFTLIEALIAMFIFSWIGLAAYQILDQIVLAQEVNQRHSGTLANVQRASWQLSRDFRQIVERPVTDQNGSPLNAFVSNGEDNLIEFTRRGWPNPLQWPRSELQRVAYLIDYHPEYDDRQSEFYEDESLYLIREYWQVLDRATDVEPRQQVLLRDVVDFRVRCWNQTTEEWEDCSGSSVAPTPPIPDLPSAIEVSIVLESEEVLTYIYPLL